MSDVLDALGPLVDELGRLGIAYTVVGSVASSAYGVARSTIDIDLVAPLRRHEVAPLCEALLERYYVDLDDARDSPEDTILHKLEWYRAGGEVSERQWGDLLGVLRVQGPALDAGYLRRWAVTIGVEDLLDRAMQEAG